MIKISIQYWWMLEYNQNLFLIGQTGFDAVNAAADLPENEQSLKVREERGEINSFR